MPPEADTLLLFLSHIDHEVLDVHADGERPPRCAITQWFQDLAPPIIASTGEGVAPTYSPPYDGADDASKLQRVAVGVT